jgi:uncharacterized linocin/CFP29 family protein
MESIISAGGPTSVDFLTLNGNGGFKTSASLGTLAQRLLLSNFNAKVLRTNATLRKDEWISLDNALIEIARQRLRLAGDLMSRGLTHNLRNAMGKTRLEWETVSDMTEAEINMSGLTQAEEDRVNFELTGMPIPIIHKDFSINIRALAASRETGESLDTTQVALAGRLVSEKIEDLICNGGYSVGANGSIFGYTNALNRNTGSLTGSWSDIGTTGIEIVQDQIEMIGVLHGDHMFGPYTTYVPALAFVNLADDYKAESDRTTLERLNAIPSLETVAPADNLAATEVVTVQMTRDVVDLVNGMQPTVVQWDEKGGFQMMFKVMAIMLPRMKSDQSGQSGIVHYSE